MNFLPLPLFLFCTLFPLILCRGLREEFSWTRINYDWPNGQADVPVPSPGGDAIAFPGNTYKGRMRRPTSTTTARPGRNDSPYIYQNNIPMGANVWNQKLFITVPRRRVGVPSTLNYVWVNSTKTHNLPLIPYPDWNTNTIGNEDGVRFVSVYRVAVDSCDRLWFVDTGTIETIGNPQHIQNHTLIIMDLNTDKIIHRYVFEDSVMRPATSLASVTVDVDANKCGDAFGYFPDLSGYGLIVYSFRDNKAWRVSHNYFFLDPHAGEFNIGGHQFQWNDGIFSISTSDLKSDGSRDAYFHSMAGVHQHRVSTKLLKNESLSTRSYHMSDFEIVGHKGDRTQTSSSDLFKPRGILFLALVNQNAVGCWNINTPLTDISIVQKDDKKMIYPSDVKISGENVVVLTNTMPVFLYGNLNYDQTNFRVWVETVNTAVRGTKCDAK